jgi:hypothetical protein
MLEPVPDLLLNEQDVRLVREVITVDRRVRLENSGSRDERYSLTGKSTSVERRCLNDSIVSREFKGAKCSFLRSGQENEGKNDQGFQLCHQKESGPQKQFMGCLA